jgi:hypothetical protein
MGRLGKRHSEASRFQASSLVEELLMNSHLTHLIREGQTSLVRSAPIAFGILVGFSAAVPAQPQEAAGLRRSEPFTQASILRDHLRGQPFVIVAIQPVRQIPRYTCPSGYELLNPVTNPFCQPPVRGTCTTYWCIESITGRMTLATPTLTSDTNPSCQSDSMQTEPCSNDVKLEERFVPSRQQLVKTLPGLFPKELSEVPIGKPGK